MTLLQYYKCDQFLLFLNLDDTEHKDLVYVLFLAFIQELFFPYLSYQNGCSAIDPHIKGLHSILLLIKFFTIFFSLFYQLSRKPKEKEGSLENSGPKYDFLVLICINCNFLFFFSTTISNPFSCLIPKKAFRSVDLTFKPGTIKE